MFKLWSAGSELVASNHISSGGRAVAGVAGEAVLDGKF